MKPEMGKNLKKLLSEVEPYNPDVHVSYFCEATIKSANTFFHRIPRSKQHALDLLANA